MSRTPSTIPVGDLFERSGAQPPRCGLCGATISRGSRPWRLLQPGRYLEPLEICPACVPAEVRRAAAKRLGESGPP